VAVHDRGFRPYDGPRTPRWRRLLVIPRYAARDVLRSRMLLVALLGSFVYPAIASVLIYLRHNTTALEILGIDPKQLLQIGPGFFHPLLTTQCLISFVLVLAVGPSLVSADLRNNALCLYLARPLQRWEYVLGKFSVLFVLASVVTWVPLLALYVFQASLEGRSWMAENGFLGPAMLLACLAWIVFLSLYALAVSATVRFKPFARAMMVGIIIALQLFGTTINGMLDVRWGTLVNPGGLFGALWRALLDRAAEDDLSQPVIWAALILMTLALMGLLRRKLRAYEVVR
jgi:ABC-2 type transport system permease protein